MQESSGERSKAEHSPEIPISMAMARISRLSLLRISELKDKCGTYIILEVDDAGQMAVILEKELGITEYKILPDGHFNIYTPPERKEEISRAAILHGIGLHAISALNIELEDYYMNLMGGNADA